MNVDRPRASLVTRVLDRATRPPALTWFAAMKTLVVVAVLVRYVFGLPGVVDADCNVVVGDYLAFHTAATLIASHEGAALYDFARQKEVQERLTGCSLPRWQPYVNPPLLALALVPFVPLGPRAAFHFFGALSLLGLVAALVACRRALPALHALPLGWMTTALLVFGFSPIASTLAGGQNTVLSLAFVLAFYSALSTRRDALAGLWLGLLGYKPVLLPVLLLVLALRSRWRTLGVASVVMLAHWLLGACVAGPEWPLRLLETGARYRALEWQSNLATHISIVPFVERWLPSLAGSVVAYALAAAVALATASVARRPAVPDAAAWGLAFVAMLLASPHLQYYDVGLVAVPVLLGVDRRLSLGRTLPSGGRLALAAAYLGYPVYALSVQIGFQPLTLVLVGVFAWLWREAAVPAQAEALPSP